MPIYEQNGLQINTDYQYEDHDITTILQLKIDDFFKYAEHDKPLVMACVDNIVTPEITERQLKQSLLEFQKQEKRIALIPCNIGGNHWVGLIVEKSENGNIVRAEYIDPITQQIDQEVQNQFNSIYPGITLTSKSLLTQTDSTSCGAYTINNLYLAATQPNITRPELESRGEELRAEHIKLLLSTPDTQFFGGKFYRRQLSNVATVDGLSAQLEYLTGAHRSVRRGTTMTARSVSISIPIANQDPLSDSNFVAIDMPNSTSVKSSKFAPIFNNILTSISITGFSASELFGLFRGKKELPPTEAPDRSTPADLTLFTDLSTIKPDDIKTGLDAVKTAGMQREFANHLTLLAWFLDNAMLIFRAGNIPDYNSMVSVKGTDVHSKTATTGIGRQFIPTNPLFSKPKRKGSTEAIGLDEHNLHEISQGKRETIQLTRTLHDLLKLSLDPDGDIMLARCEKDAKDEARLVFKYRDGKEPIFNGEKFEGEFFIKLNGGKKRRKYYARPWDQPTQEIIDGYKDTITLFSKLYSLQYNQQVIEALVSELDDIHTPKEYGIYYKEYRNPTIEKEFTVFSKDKKPITGDWDMFGITMPTAFTKDLPADKYSKAFNASGTMGERRELMETMKELFHKLQTQARQNSGIFQKQENNNLLKRFLLDTQSDGDFIFENFCEDQFFLTAGVLSAYEGLFIAIVNYIYNPKNFNKYFGESKTSKKYSLQAEGEDQGTTNQDYDYLFFEELLNVWDLLRHGAEARNPHAGNPAISSGSAGPYFIIYNGTQFYMTSEQDLIDLLLSNELLEKQFFLVHFSNPMEKWWPVIEKQINLGQKTLIDPRTLESYYKYKFLTKIENDIEIIFTEEIIAAITSQFVRGQPIHQNIKDQFDKYVAETLLDIERSLQSNSTLILSDDIKNMIKYYKGKNIPNLMRLYKDQLVYELNSAIHNAIDTDSERPRLTNDIIDIIKSKYPNIPILVKNEFENQLLLKLEEEIEDCYYHGTKPHFTEEIINIIKLRTQQGQQISPIILEAYKLTLLQHKRRLSITSIRQPAILPNSVREENAQEDSRWALKLRNNQPDLSLLSRSASSPVIKSKKPTN